MMRVLLIFLAGGLGSIARYGITIALNRHGEDGVPAPLGTLTVNVVGALIIGIAAELLTEKSGVSETTKLAIVAGLLGGFTTFSSFAYETQAMAENGAPIRAVGYGLGSIVLGLSAAWLGVSIARWMTGEQ